MKSLILFGNMDMNHAARRMGQGKAISPMFFSTLSTIILAAFSADMKKGIGQVFLSVMRDFTKPGQITLT